MNLSALLRECIARSSWSWLELVSEVIKKDGMLECQPVRIREDGGRGWRRARRSNRPHPSVPCMCSLGVLPRGARSIDRHLDRLGLEQPS